MNLDYKAVRIQVSIQHPAPQPLAEYLSRRMPWDAELWGCSIFAERHRRRAHRFVVVLMLAAFCPAISAFDLFGTRSRELRALCAAPDRRLDHEPLETDGYAIILSGSTTCYGQFRAASFIGMRYLECVREKIQDFDAALAYSGPVYHMAIEQKGHPDCNQPTNEDEKKAFRAIRAWATDEDLARLFGYNADRQCFAVRANASIESRYIVVPSQGFVADGVQYPHSDMSPGHTPERFQTDAITYTETEILDQETGEVIRRERSYTLKHGGLHSDFGGRETCPSEKGERESLFRSRVHAP